MLKDLEINSLSEKSIRPPRSRILKWKLYLRQLLKWNMQLIVMLAVVFIKDRFPNLLRFGRRKVLNPGEVLTQTQGVRCAASTISEADARTVSASWE